MEWRFTTSLRCCPPRAEGESPEGYMSDIHPVLPAPRGRENSRRDGSEPGCDEACDGLCRHARFEAVPQNVGITPL